LKRIHLFLALLFGNELPQHPQQAGIIDPYCDVASVIRGKILFEMAMDLTDRT
jgi:hypothetical protein